MDLDLRTSQIQFTAIVNPVPVTTLILLPNEGSLFYYAILRLLQIVSLKQHQTHLQTFEHNLTNYTFTK